MTSFNYDAVKDLLRCPRTRAELVLVDQALVSCDPETRLCYPIIDGVPVLLGDEASSLTADQWAAAMEQSGRDPATGQVASTPGGDRGSGIDCRSLNLVGMVAPRPIDST